MPPTKINRAATSSPRRRPGSQSLGIARRAKCPPTSTARFRRVRSALVLVNVLYTEDSKHSSLGRCFLQNGSHGGRKSNEPAKACHTNSIPKYIVCHIQPRAFEENTKLIVEWNPPNTISATQTNWWL